MTTKPIIVTLIGSVLAFAAGMVTTRSWHKTTTPTIVVAAVAQQPSPGPSPTPAVTPEPEVVFGHGRLRIVSEEINLKSEQLHYEINVRYPQIVGSDAAHINNLNQRIRRLVVNHYQWALNPSKAELRRYKTAPEQTNLVDINYQIELATDSNLSIFFFTQDYLIGAAHATIRSHVINYDLKAHRELKLADLFNTNPYYLDFIAHYCTVDLGLSEEITPKAETFANWNLTADGIKFVFDPCYITGCSEGAHEVIMPFTALRDFLKRRKPV